MQAVLLRLVERVPAHDADAVLLEGRPDAVVEGGRVTDLQAVGGLVDGGEHLGGGAADVRGDGEARGDAALEAGDADHEELVEVAGEDGEEVGALEDGQLGVLRQLEDAAVERQPAQLAVEEAALGEGPVVLEELVLVIEVVQGFGDRLRIADVRLAVHPPIMASWCALRPPAGERRVNRIRVAPGEARGSGAAVLDVDRGVAERGPSVEREGGRVVGLDVEVHLVEAARGEQVEARGEER